MTQAAIRPGWLYPEVDYAFTQASLAVMDAATEKIAHIGRLYIDGAPSGAKTLSTGTIQFQTGTCTFADGSTTLDVGIQDVATGAGPIAQPDGTFDVKATLTGGAGITTAAWNTVTMNSGTKDMSHGDLIAVVWDMTARAGSDSVIVATENRVLSNALSQLPTTNSFVAGAWQTTITLGAGRNPNVIIVFDDGTLGWLDLSLPISTSSTEQFQNSTNPDERGLIFQVPWDCKVDALWMHESLASAAADFTMKLYSDPLGTPTLLASDTHLAEISAGGTGASYMSVPTKVAGVITEISLTKDTDYLVTVLATGTANVALTTNILNNEAHRAYLNNGLTLKKATRNNSTGAFTAENPAITRYIMGVRICSLDDGAGSGVVAHVIGG